jgi:putative transposase
MPPPHVIARSNLERAAIEKVAARRTPASGRPVQSPQYQSSTSLVIRCVSPTSGKALRPSCRWSELGSAAGVDRGVVVAVASSDGRLDNRDFVTDGELPRTLRLQRRLARAAKQSRNRAKTREALNAIRARERHRRQDYCAQTAHQLAARHGLVVIEDLKINQMTRSAKGKNRGTRNQRKGQIRPQPRHLVQGVAPVHAGTVVGARYTGTRVVTVPPHHTSQRCSTCGQVDPKSRESQAVFRCTHCGHVEHADVNAAKNILAAGLAVTACEDSPQALELGRLAEAGTSRKPRGITAPTSHRDVTGWNSLATTAARTSI